MVDIVGILVFSMIMILVFNAIARKYWNFNLKKEVDVASPLFDFEVYSHVFFVCV